MKFLDLNKFSSGLSDLTSVGSRLGRQAFTAGEVGLSTLGFAYVNGRFAPIGKDHHEIGIGSMKAPTDLTSAFIFHALAAFGIFGEYNKDFANVGTGALSAYLARLGTSLGVAAKARAATQKTSGPWQRQLGYMPTSSAHRTGAWQGMPAWAHPR